MLLQLLGGIEKSLDTKTHLRGDINILMVGDPSTAKSQLLRQVMSIAPLTVNTTGRGSSGVGLTAACVTDQDTGERHLEAGAMVLADRGIVCIDEFDKMNEVDRVAIHEVMEQQTVTISKAGIHCSLNARCSVLAAANPIYGDYDRHVAAAKNIGLPDSLLSRFDLLFVVLDEKNPGLDAKIAQKVIGNHQYKSEEERKGGASKTAMMKMGLDDTIIQGRLSEEDSGAKTPVYTLGSNGQKVLNLRFLKKYLSYAKKMAKPVLSQEAVDFVSAAYGSLRMKGDMPEFQGVKKLPITVRTLETLIRLGTAHAKVRLSDTVGTEDLQVALKLLNFCIFNEDDD